MLRRGRAAAWRCRCASRLDRERTQAHDRSATTCRRLTLGTLSDWVTLTFPARAGSQGQGHYAPAGHRDGRALLAVRVADQPRSRKAGDADLASVVLRHLPRQEGRAVLRRSAWPRTRGRSTKASSTTGRSCSRPTTSIASARRCSSRRSIGCAAAAWCACSTPPIASSTCSGATSTRRIRPARGRETAPHRDAIRELYRHNDALVGRVHGATARRRRADGASRITASTRSAAAST